MYVRNLDDLFRHELQQLYLAEKMFLEALPKLTTKGAGPAADSIMQALGRIQRLEQIFRMIDQTPTASASWAMGGILRDADWLLDSAEDPGVRELAKEAAVQTCRRYFMARYTLLVGWANCLGKSTVEKLLGATLDAESLLDKGEAKTSTMGSRLTALFDRKV